MMPHIEGPYTVHDTGKGNILINATVDGETVGLARIWPTHPKTKKRLPEYVGVAHLFGAAPELLAEVKAFRRTVEYYMRVEANDGDDEGARLKAFRLHTLDALIAKAEGQTP